METEKKTGRVINGKFYEYYPAEEVDGSHRIITGQEIIDWIRGNHFENTPVFLHCDDIYVGFIDSEDPDHFKEIRLNWHKKSPMLVEHDGRTE